MSDRSTNSNVVWSPQPKQALFLSCSADWVLFGGGAGGGKSDALLADFLRYIGDRYYQGILFRRSYPELEELIARSRELYEPLGAKYNESKKVWRFPSGATLKFRYAEKDDDIRRYQGHAYQFVAWDELTHFSKFMWDYMSTRNRPRRDGQKCVMRATCNPDGKGLNWVKAMFIDVAKPMQLVRRWVTNPITGDRQCITQKFIPSLLRDNAYLRGTGYALRMANLGDADRKALLEGDWEAYIGTVFNLVEGVHKWSWDKFKEVTGHSRIPDDWLRFRLMDWGFAKPFAVLWIAVDYDGRAYVYREYYGCAVDGNGRFIPNEGVRQTAQAVARKIADIERESGERISFAWSGPDIDHLGRGDHELGRKISESFRDEGIFWDHWNANAGSRIAKKQHLHSRLSYDVSNDGAIKRYPMLVILSEECPHLIRTLPMLEYDRHIPEDVNSDGEDHLYDALAGFCLMRTWEPKKNIYEPKWDRGRERGEGWTM